MTYRELKLTDELINIIYQMGDIALKNGGNSALEAVNILYKEIANAPILTKENKPHSEIKVIEDDGHID
jgi:hypothetical protein